MKKLILILTLIFSAPLARAQNPDCLIDSVRLVSPYWGMHFETGTVQDTFMNCGSSNTNFAVGNTYKILKFPFGIANMGTSVAYFGRYGVNGVTHDRCYSPQFTSPTDFINIPNFNRSYLLDSCGNIIAWNSKTDFNIQNSGYAMGVSNGRVGYYTEYFPATTTFGSQPNILKDWLESYCGPLDTNMAYYGFNQLDSYSRSCQTCDSLTLFPNYASWDDAIIQLPNTISPGKYYLAVACNFYMMNQGSNCYPDSIVIPFTWDGSFGISQTFPYPANGVTYQSTGFGTCAQLVQPQAPSSVTASTNGNSVTISWASSEPSSTQFTVTPYVVVGNVEKAVTSLVRNFSTSPASYTNAELRSASEVSLYLGGSRNNIKFRFKVSAFNSVGTSGQVTSGNPAVQVR